MSDYRSRKADRTAEFQAKSGRKLITCTACSGSGIYDHNGSPPCGCCNGTGRVRESLPFVSSPEKPWRERLGDTMAFKRARCLR